MDHSNKQREAPDPIPEWVYALMCVPLAVLFGYLFLEAFTAPYPY